MLNVVVGFTFAVVMLIGNLSVCLAQDNTLIISEPPRIKIITEIPYYVGGYGINTKDTTCEPKTEYPQNTAVSIGCLYPQEYEETDEPTIIDCEAYEYLQGTPSAKAPAGSTVEYQFCVFDKNKRVMTGYIEDGVYNSGQPLNMQLIASPKMVKLKSSIQLSKKNHKSAASSKPEACATCSTQLPQVPPISTAAKGASSVSADIARAATTETQMVRPLNQASRSDLKCDAKYVAPTHNPDLYFYNKAREVSDPVCSFNRYMDYKKYILESSKAFEMPEIFLFCLLHQESRNPVSQTDKNGNVIMKKNINGKLYAVHDYTKDWDPKAISDAHAVGVGQFMDSTFPDLPKNILPIRDYMERWTNYFENTNRRKVPSTAELAVRKKLTDFTAKKQCDARCEPDIGFGAAGLYARYIMDEHGNDFENKNVNLENFKRIEKERKRLLAKQKRTATETQALNKLNQKYEAGREYLVFIGGSYNRGPGAIDAAMTENTGAYQWQENMIQQNGGSKSEVAKHMKKIQDCMIELGD